MSKKNTKLPKSTEETMKLLSGVKFLSKEDATKGIGKVELLICINQQLRLELEQVKKEVERRRNLIISEPDGIVRETMIANLADDLTTPKNTHP